ncbi:MAG: ketoacyl-ACP synthase III, partial [Deltaproteobacteria bacterium]|nr:ketoacyl-ACP synthase III [Deltaproteobacteria bacterium]
MRASITGIGHFVPERKLTNFDLEQMVDTNDEWIYTRTGIKERRILDKDKGVSDMAVKAAKKVLAQTDTHPDELDLIIMATTTFDMMFPSTAAIVQDALNAKNCWGYDLVTGCSGFLFAISTASQFIETGKHKKVMVIGADKMSSILNYKDRNTCILFGDGAGAVLLEPSDEDDYGVEDYINHIDGSGGQYLYMPGGGSLHPASYETIDKGMHFVHQDGKILFKKAIIAMTDSFKEITEKNNLTTQDIKFFIPHQANARIIKAVAEKLGLTKKQAVINIEKHGNTTAATIPIAMSELYQNGK